MFELGKRTLQSVVLVFLVAKFSSPNFAKNAEIAQNFAFFNDFEKWHLATIENIYHTVHFDEQ